MDTDAEQLARPFPLRCPPGKVRNRTRFVELSAPTQGIFDMRHERNVPGVALN